MPKMGERPGITGSYVTPDISVDKFGFVTSAATNLSINDNLIATVSGTLFSGPVVASGGLSGSLQNLSDGTSYLVADTFTISITTASNGQVLITAVEGNQTIGQLWHRPTSGTLFDDEFDDFVPGSPWKIIDVDQAGVPELTGSRGFDILGMTQEILTGSSNTQYRYMTGNSWLSIQVPTVSFANAHKLFMYKPVSNFPTNCVIWARFGAVLQGGDINNGGFNNPPITTGPNGAGIQVQDNCMMMMGLFQSGSGVAGSPVDRPADVVPTVRFGKVTGSNGSAIVSGKNNNVIMSVMKNATRMEQPANGYSLSTGHSTGYYVLIKRDTKYYPFMIGDDGTVFNMIDEIAAYETSAVQNRTGWTGPASSQIKYMGFFLSNVYDIPFTNGGIMGYLTFNFDFIRVMEGITFPLWQN